MTINEYKSADYWQEQRKSAKAMDFVGIAIAGAVLAACVIGSVWA